MQTAAVTDWRAGFHLFGYNDKTPWSADSSCMLGLRTALSPRDLQPGDSAQIGLIPFSKGGQAGYPPCTFCYRSSRACALSCRARGDDSGQPVRSSRWTVLSPCLQASRCRRTGRGGRGSRWPPQPPGTTRLVRIPVPGGRSKPPPRDFQASRLRTHQCSAPMPCILPCILRRPPLVRRDLMLLLDGNALFL